MAAGDREVQKIFADMTTNNVKAVVAHSNLTRKMVRDLEKEVKHLSNLVREYDKKFELMKKQLAVLQAKLYSGGS